MPDCVGVLKYGLYSVRPALPESRSFQMPESHRGPTLKHRPQHRAEDTESLERLRQQISIRYHRLAYIYPGYPVAPGSQRRSSGRPRYSKPFGPHICLLIDSVPGP
eukprot:jgi/Chrzof1/2354/Cz11g12020.t1